MGGSGPMRKTEGGDLQKRAPGTDKVKAADAKGRIERLLKAEAIRYWKENPLIVGGDRPVDEENDGNDDHEG
jgi:hypothetical protein